MDTASKSAVGQDGVIRVVDAKTVLGELLGFVMGIGLIIYCVVKAFEHPAWLFGLVIAIPLTIAMFFILKAKKSGYEIDIQNDTFSYPGGRAADELSDYIRLEWYLQRLQLKRSSVSLSSITHISGTNIHRQKWDEQFKRWKNIYEYTISIEGTFGTITNYLSEGKRDQLYSMLQQTLNMGEPIVVVDGE